MLEKNMENGITMRFIGLRCTFAQQFSTATALPVVPALCFKVCFRTLFDDIRTLGCTQLGESL